MKGDLNSSTLQISGPFSLIMDQDHQNNERNELDLFQLFSKIYEKRKLIIIITILCTVLATIIAFIIPPSYRVETTLIAPSLDQIQTIYLNTNSKISSSALFQKFSKELSYKGNIINYLQYSGLLEEALKNFKDPSSKKTRINTLNKLALNYKTTFIQHNANDRKDNLNDGSREITLSTFSKHLDLDAKNNQDYIAFTNKQLLTKFVKEQQAITEKKIAKLEKQIKHDLVIVSLNRKYKIKQLKDDQALNIAKINTQIEALKQRDLRDRQLQLQELNNALKIATALGIKKPNEIQKVDNQSVVIDVNSNRNDLYMRGTIYLQNEIDMVKKRPHTINYDRQLSELQEKIEILQKDQTILALKNRMDDKPYLNNIAGKQTELSRLKSLSFDLSKVKAYSIDGMPFVELSPIKPKKKIIIIFGFIFGVLISFVIILVQSLIKIRTINNANPNYSHNI